jgi:hypothetical protein
VAYANLTIGTLGLSSFFYRRHDYLLAAMVGYCSWFFADGVGHVVSLLVSNDVAPSNAGSVLYTDLFTPFLVVLLLWLSRKQRCRLR